MYKIQTEKILYFINMLSPLFSSQLEKSGCRLPSNVIVPVKELSGDLLRFSTKDIIQSIANSYKKEDLKKSFLLIAEKTEDQTVDLEEADCEEIVEDHILD